MTGQDGQFPVQDTTERKRAEDSLRVREALFEVLTENSYDLIRLHELDGRSIYANPAVVQLLGEEPANLFDDIHPEDLEKGQQWWQHILTGGETGSNGVSTTLPVAGIGLNREDRSCSTRGGRAS